MAWLIYVRGLRSPAPQIVFDGVGDKPFVDDANRGCVLTEHRLSEDEAAMSIAELVARYPAPRVEVA